MSLGTKFAQLLFGSNDSVKLEYFENLAQCFEEREREYEIINLDITTSIPEDSIFFGVDIRSVIEYESGSIGSAFDINEQQSNALRDILENENWIKTAFLEPTSNYMIINLPDNLEIPVFDSIYKELFSFLRENNFNFIQINFLDASLFQTPNDLIAAYFTFSAISTTHEYSGIPILNALVNVQSITDKHFKKCGKIIGMPTEKIFEQTIFPIRAITGAALTVFSNFAEISHFKTLDFYNHEELNAFVEIIDSLLEYDPDYDKYANASISSEDVSDDQLIVHPFDIDPECEED